MKHFDSGGNTFAARSGNLLKIILSLVLVLVMLLLQQELWGQCTMLCTNPDQSAPKMISIDTLCNATVRASALLVAPQDCDGPKIITIRDGMSNLIGFGRDSILFDASLYTNQLLSVTMQDSASGIFCVGFIAPIDDTPPRITCTNQTMSCLDESTIEIVIPPTVTDNCDADITPTYHDEILGTDCNKIIRRTWTAMDDSGNEATCVQDIVVTRPDLEEVIYPKDTVLSCAINNDTSVVALGAPVLQNLVLDATGSICGLYATHVDSVKRGCSGYTYEILRYWIIKDSCSGSAVHGTQSIQVIDTVAPTITCLPALVVGTDPGQCYASVQLPAPTVVDNCDPNAQFFVSTSYGAVGLGPHPYVPTGAHTVQYTATDSCGNTRTCSMMLSVVDQDPPAAICEQYTTVGLPLVGIVKVPAKTFDQGSKDNCASKLYFKVRKMTIGTCAEFNGDDAPAIDGYQEWFDDSAFFCCEEAGQEAVQVLFRVYEVNPGAGPVDPKRDLPGGDLYGHFNECMVRVAVQDKLPPVINCPADTTIDCKTDYTNLSKFGSPVVKENCGFTLDSTIVKNINECGTGTITRTFKARDNFGNESICTQTITVVNKNPLKATDIEWPKMYIANTCGAKTDPKDLPDGYNKPIIRNDHCLLVATAYTDQLFDIAQPACYKVLRTWEVIDWCVYNPDVSPTKGKFTFTQTIKIDDTLAPILTCPADISLSTGKDCGPVQVTIPTVTAQDCSTYVVITNDSPYATAKGANASGTYPIGVTIVKFTAIDHCGNTSTCKVKVTIEDRVPPSPVCIVGLSINLSTIDGEIKAIVKASQFNGGSSDNCTPANKLKFSLQRVGAVGVVPPIDSQLVFTCADIGSKLVEFWATDEKGNSSHCVTYILVQDNNRICPQPQSGMVAGGIQNERGDKVENVKIRVNNNSFEALTSTDGYFEFPKLPIGGDYTLVPEKNDDPLNGVSTMDVVLISKHILGVQKFDSPYKLIAADVDKSRTVTALDLVKLRKIILGLEQELPNGNKSWRFLDAKYKFPSPTNPFQTEFPEIYNINDFNGIPMDIDFVAVKVGDVNGSSRANNAVNVESRAAARTLKLATEDRSLKAGEIYTLDLKPSEAAQLLGYQFSLYFDPALLEFVNVENGDLPDMSETNFNTQLAAEGVLTTSWNTSNPTTVKPEEALFHLTFRAKKDALLSKALQIEPRRLHPEAYETETEVLNIGLEFKAAPKANVTPAQVQGSFELYQNAPNPFATQTVVSFRLPQSSVAKLVVFDVTGKIVYSKEGTFNEGYNEIIITRDEVQGEGMLYYRLDTQEGRNATKKMMLLD